MLKSISFYNMQNMQEKRAGEGAATVRNSGDSAKAGNLKIKHIAELGFVIIVAVPSGHKTSQKKIGDGPPPQNGIFPRNRICSGGF